MEEGWFENQKFWEDFRSVLFHRDRMRSTSQQVDKIVEILDLKVGDKVLDLCCGVGRHTLEFARRGYEVTGVDLTEKYIEKGEKKAKKEGVDAEFVKSDMRDFRRENTYDAAINFFSSFGYFNDERDNFKVIENVHSSLKNSGKFLIDVMGKKVMAREFTQRGEGRLDDGYFIEERDIKGDWDLLENKWTLIKDDQVHKGTFYIKIYSSQELKEILERAGFTKIDIYGDLERSEYGEDAERLIAVACK
ncbi:MAG: class I SAM-dependent methyltransferase [Candidatus Saliniplasma sp.]